MREVRKGGVEERVGLQFFCSANWAGGSIKGPDDAVLPPELHHYT